LYIGSDANDLPLVDTVTGSPYGTYDTSALDLQLSQTYYWRIDEVNEAQVPSLWEGDDVQSFTVTDFVVVDDFESYTNDAESYSRVFQTWIDGAGYTVPVDFPGNGTGSYMGYDPTAGDIMEMNIFHGGSQSAPISYGNDGKSSSEVVRTFAEAQDWTGHGITTLVVYFYGYPENVPGQLYVKINNTRVDYSGSTDALLRSRWTQWDIDLADVSAAGDVTSLTLGIEGAGSEGTLLVDDILLYRVPPEITVVEPVDPGTDGLVAYYDMENNLLDGSGNGLNGTAIGSPIFSAGLGSFGTALSLAGADCVDLGEQAVFNPIGSFSVSLWANAATWNSDWGHAMIGNRGEDNIGWQIRRYGSSSNIAFTTRGVGNDDTQSNAVMPLGDWVHIVCVYDNSANTKQIYVNGILDQEVTTNAGASITATTHNTYIGARANSGNTGQEAYFTGLLDEIRVYNRALSVGEVEFLSDPTP
jgi:hypothetical protein